MRTTPPYRKNITKQSSGLDARFFYVQLTDTLMSVLPHLLQDESISAQAKSEARQPTRNR